MNLKEDLENLEKSDDFGDSLIQQAITEQEEIVKKIYMLKVVSLAKKIDDLTKSDFFSKDGIEFIQITYEYDDENFRLEFYLVDQDEEIMGGYSDADGHKQIEALTEKFEAIYPLDLELVSSNLKGNSINFELKPGIKESIVNLLLNSELIKLYNYNKMQSELPQGNEASPRKIKM